MGGGLCYARCDSSIINGSKNTIQSKALACTKRGGAISKSKNIGEYINNHSTHANSKTQDIHVERS